MEVSKYKISQDAVTYLDRCVVGADPESFLALEVNWGRDKDSVFRMDKKIQKADPNSFQALNLLFAKDAKTVWAFTGKIANADAQSFRALDRGQYACPLSSNLIRGYATDSENVYYMSVTREAPKLVRKADPGSITSLGGDWAADFQYVFCEGILVKGANPDRFSIIGDSYLYGKDDKHVFYGPGLIADADPESFRIVDELNMLARDDCNWFKFAEKCAAPARQKE
jgi:hypothetical protein